MNKVDIINALAAVSHEDALMMFKEAVARRAAVATMSLKFGDKVSFDARSKGVKVGEVIKINRKSAKVRVGNVEWRVTASLLQKVA